MTSEEEKAKKRSDYRKRVESGLCTRCNNPAKQDRVLCERHLRKAYIEQQKCRKRKQALGFCVRCKNRARPKRTLCEKCATKENYRVLMAQRKARKIKDKQ